MTVNIRDLLGKLAEADDAAQALHDQLSAADDLEAVQKSATEAFKALHEADGDRTDAELVELEQLANIIKSVTNRRVEAAARADRIRSLAEEVEQASTPAPNAPTTPPAPDPVTEDAPAADAAPAETTPVADERVPVAAASKAAVPFGRMRNDDVKTGTVVETGWSMIAAADIPNTPAGQRLTDLTAVAEAAQNRMTALGRIPSGSSGVHIAQFTLDRDPSLVTDGSSDAETWKTIEHATNERRLTNGSLIAATGVGGAPATDIWCSPSETIYTLCPDLASLDGIVDVPAITVRRGGLRWPITPSFTDVYTQLGGGIWDWGDLPMSDPSKGPNPGGLLKDRPEPGKTLFDPKKTKQEKDQARADNPKPCLEIPCPEWAECRLTPRGLCIKTDIMLNHTWPELIREWIARLLVAHQHLINADTLARMEAKIPASEIYKFAAAVDRQQALLKGQTGRQIDPKTGHLEDAAKPAAEPIPFSAGQAAYGPGATAGLLGAIEVMVEDMRYKHRLSRGSTLEAVMPYWLPGIIRSDLAKRTGVDLIDVPDSRINAWFTSRGIRPQYVYDWQNIDPKATTWPSTAKIMLYTAGYFIQARQDILNLDGGIYDSTLLGQNKMISLFTEEAYCLQTRCGDARMLQIDLCPNGMTGGPDNAALICPAA
ncbi:major capsid protein [Streptomyces sp. NBC_01304]|uniref:major capsid protein n=1 Tax=Streptomyces sp. NBC_01304 TaxID=2903818 RepID=UPI002E13D105|nr:major capsid protein [Streptomyces sp. NBC_01304]